MSVSRRSAIVAMGTALLGLISPLGWQEVSVICDQAYRVDFDGVERTALYTFDEQGRVNSILYRRGSCTIHHYEYP